MHGHTDWVVRMIQLFTGAERLARSSCRSCLHIGKGLMGLLRMALQKVADIMHN